ncbi:hypothetical protein ID866_2756 [Astraeus odoratus]|nr:hypothetical protein ID866_2756 [Astraeus odoratus]
MERLDNSHPSLVLPHLFPHSPYPTRLNPNYLDVSCASEKWFTDYSGFTSENLARSKGIKAAMLLAYCYPDADADHLRICADFLGWLFSVDDWIDDYDSKDLCALRKCCINAFCNPNLQTDERDALMVQSFFSRFLRDAGPNCTERLLNTTDLFFDGCEKEISYRASGHIPDLEPYLTYRRESSGSKPCLVVFEYTAGIDLPNKVVSHSVIMAMEDIANDLVSWSNVR